MLIKMEKNMMKCHKYNQKKFQKEMKIKIMLSLMIKELQTMLKC